MAIYTKLYSEDTSLFLQELLHQPAPSALLDKVDEAGHPGHHLGPREMLQSREAPPQQSHVIHHIILLARLPHYFLCGTFQLHTPYTLPNPMLLLFLHDAQQPSGRHVEPVPG